MSVRAVPAPLAIATVVGSSSLAALGWQLSDLWVTPPVGPLCRAAVSLLEQSLASRRSDLPNESHCNGVEARVEARIASALEKLAAEQSLNSSFAAGGLRAGIAELSGAGPWILEGVLVLAGWCLLTLRHCVYRVLRWWSAPEMPAVQLRAVRRRLG